jgi:hypothetical protein
MGSITGTVRGITGNVILRVWSPTFMLRIREFLTKEYNRPVVLSNYCQ